MKNYSLSSSTLSSRIIGGILKNVQKTTVCFNDAVLLMVREMRLKMKKILQRYNINRPMDTN